MLAGSINIGAYSSTRTCTHSHWTIHNTLNCIPFSTLSVLWEKSAPSTYANFKLLVLLICWENGACFGKAIEVEEGGGDSSAGLVSPRLSLGC